jgi:hypothetical protein
MPSLTELSTENLRDAGVAVETVIEFRDYLPPGGALRTRGGGLGRKDLAGDG